MQKLSVIADTFGREHLCPGEGCGICRWNKNKGIWKSESLTETEAKTLDSAGALCDTKRADAEVKTPRRL